MTSLGAGEITGLGFEQVVRDAPLSIVVVDADGEVLFTNRRARELTARQLSREMPTDLDGAIDIFHPDGRRYERHEWPAVRSLMFGEEIVDEEFFYVRPEGGRLWIRCSSSPLRDGDGQMVAAVLAQTDITERKREEARLTYLAGLLDTTEDAIVAVDAEWRVTAWNAAAERFYGWKAEEVLGRQAVEFGLLPMSPEERADVRRAVAAHGRWRGEVMASRKHGAPVWIDLLMVALRDAQGEITGYVGIRREIADRKRAEDALRAAQRRSETILESMGEPFSAVDHEWRFTYINQRALKRVRARRGGHLTADDLLGVSCWEFFPELVGTTIEGELRRSMREQRPVEFEAYSQASASWLELRAYPSEEGLSVYCHDITERKRAEEERERRARQQAMVADLGLRALTGDDLQALMDEAVDLVARTLDVEFAAVAELPAGSDDVIVRAGVGWREGVVGRALERGRDSQAGYTLLRREPVVSEDVAADARFVPSAVAREHGVVSALSVMMQNPDVPFGVLQALSTRRRTFSEADVSFVQSVANVLAGAVARTRAEQRLDEVREAERSRIARDLHDEALQELTEALAQATVDRAVGLTPAAVEQLIATLKRAGRQLRAAIYDLHLTDEGQTFPGALRALVDVQNVMTADAVIDLDLAADTPIDVGGDRATEVLRIVREALTNARRHSGASHVRVSAGGGEDGGLRVEVADDGGGFDPARDASHHGAGRGLQGMRERAALLGGALDIHSVPGAGTVVRIALGPG